MLSYAYDSANQLTASDGPLEGARSYSYDRAGQLTGVSESAGGGWFSLPAETFSYDTNGNRRIDAGDRQLDLGQEGDKPIAGDFNGDGIDEPAVYRPADGGR